MSVDGAMASLAAMSACTVATSLVLSAKCLLKRQLEAVEVRHATHDGFVGIARRISGYWTSWSTVHARTARQRMSLAGEPAEGAGIEGLERPGRGRAGDANVANEEIELLPGAAPRASTSVLCTRRLRRRPGALASISSTMGPSRIQRDRGTHAERERPEFARAHERQRAGAFLLVEHDTPRPLDIVRRIGRGAQAAVLPVEQRYPQVVLQRPQAARQRRLAQVHRSRQRRSASRGP